MDRISSRQNPIVKRFRELIRSRGDGDHVLLEGEHLVAEALAARVPLEVAAISAVQADGRLSTLASQLRHAQVKTVAVSDAVLSAISPVRQPGGVVAIGRRRPATVEQALGGETQLVLLVSDVQDPGNVGAIVRAAEAYGVTGIVTGSGCADPFGWKALRGSMGSTFRVPVAADHDVLGAMTHARARGIRLFATVPRGGTGVDAVDLRVPSAILLGGEGAGLSEDLIEAADELLTIPMRPPVESLNVAVAAAIILYEASRQRRGA